MELDHVETRSTPRTRRLTADRQCAQEESL